MLCCYGLSSFDPGISLLMHNTLIEGLLWAEPSAGYRGRPQDRIPRPALSPTSCHEGVLALHTATVYAPLKQGTWPYCLQALTPLHLWAPHGPGGGGGDALSRLWLASQATGQRDTWLALEVKQVKAGWNPAPSHAHNHV